MPTETIKVTIHHDEDGYSLLSSDGCISVSSSVRQKLNSQLSDFAAWYFLPVAMRLKKDLHIEGVGTVATNFNARRISEIWESWLPGHMNAVDVSFSKQIKRQSPRSTRPLLFFSGGLDATYTSLKRLERGDRQDILTIQGMDYSLADQQRFEALITKTAALSNELSPTRIIVRSDAYVLYDRLGVNLKRHHLSHIFALAGAGFTMSEEYGDLILAADDRLDAQFLTFPWGTNSATNVLFSDGHTKINSDSESVARPDKITCIAKSPLGKRPLSFCWNRRVQPSNCGVCEKCLRTKLLFLAVTGHVPEIFEDDYIPKNWNERLRFREPAGFQAVQEILYTAASYQNIQRIEHYAKVKAAVFDHFSRHPSQGPATNARARGTKATIAAGKDSKIGEYLNADEANA